MLCLGTIPLDHPAVEAALSGYSDLAMRRVARAHGAPFAFHEVVLDKLVLTPGRASKRILDVPQDDHPVGGQLMGSEPVTFGKAARELVDAGYDLVDVNFGCPVPRILNRSRGGFLLGEPETALAIVDPVLQAVVPPEAECVGPVRVGNESEVVEDPAPARIAPPVTAILASIARPTMLSASNHGVVHWRRKAKQVCDPLPRTHYPHGWMVTSMASEVSQMSTLGMFGQHPMPVVKTLA